MIRFSSLQFRSQAATGFVALVIVAVLLAITGPHLVHLYDAIVATCAAHGDCSTATSAFTNTDGALQTALNTLVVVVPGIIGLFWGAPLVARELETGTFRLAWTQSVTRNRWLALKLVVVGAAGMAVAGLISLMVTWWSSPLDRVSMNVFGTFDQRDIVPIGYAAFALVLGVAAGVLVRRTLPAMAVTLVCFAFCMVAFARWVRPHLIAPLHRTLALNPLTTGYGSEGSLLSSSSQANLQPSSPNIPNAWIYSTQIVDKKGVALSPRVVADACPGLGGPPAGAPAAGVGSHAIPVPPSVQKALEDCVTKIGATYHELVTFQPGSRYWAFQWYELAIFLGAAVVLGGFCIWWVKRRIT